MKIRCVCQYGHSRSVALARALHARGHHAVAIGHATCGTAIDLLASWADRIIAVDGTAFLRVPGQHMERTWLWDVGPDRWVNPYHPELAELFRQRIEEAGL